MSINSTSCKTNPFPTPVDGHDLRCAFQLTDNARLQLAEAVQLLRRDTVLSMRAENAIMTSMSLQDSIGARLDALES